MTVDSSTDVDLKKRLGALLRKSENKVCCDCPEKRPIWASIVNPPPHAPIGSGRCVAMLCYSCAGAHRTLGSAVCTVKNISSGAWSEEEVKLAEKWGNEKVNQIFEAYLSEDPASDEMIKPTQGANIAARETFAREKYMEAKFYSKELHSQQNERISPPKSPSRRSSLLRFLKKERSESQCKEEGKNFDASTADLTPLSSLDATSILQLSAEPSENLDMLKTPKSTCPRMTLSIRKSPPSSCLNDNEWEKVTLGRAASERVQRSLEISMRETVGGVASERVQRSLGISMREKSPDRPFSMRADTNLLPKDPLHESEGSLENPFENDKSENDKSENANDAHTSSLLRRPDSHVDPRRAAFNMSKSAVSFNKNIDDAIEKDVAEKINVKTPSQPVDRRPSPKRILVASVSMPSPKNSRMMLYSATTRGRSTSRNRGKIGETQLRPRPRPRSESRQTETREKGLERRSRSASKRRHHVVSVDEFGLKRTPSMLKRNEDAAKHNSRRGRSTSRRREGGQDPTPKQSAPKEQSCIPGFIDLTDEPKDKPRTRSQSHKKRDADRSRSRSTRQKEGESSKNTGVDKRLEAYRNGTESPMRAGVRVRSGRESPLRNGGRRDRSRSNSRRRDLLDEITSGKHESKSKRLNHRRCLSAMQENDGTKSDETADKNVQSSDCIPLSKDRRSRSMTRKGDEGAQIRTRRPRSKSLESLNEGKKKLEELHIRSHARRSNPEKQVIVHPEESKPKTSTRSLSMNDSKPPSLRSITIEDMKPTSTRSLRTEDSKPTSTRSLTIEQGFSNHGGQGDNNYPSVNEDMSFQIIGGFSNPDLGFGDMSRYLGEAALNDSFRKPYRRDQRKTGGEQYEKHKRRVGRFERASEAAVRESRKSDILASLVREEDEVNNNAGPLMRRNVLNSSLEGSVRPLMMRGHVSVCDFGKDPVKKQRNPTRSWSDSAPSVGKVLNLDGSFRLDAT